jgi:NADH dehydrogenase
MEATDKKRVIIVGGGFAGINCAKALGGHPGLEVVLIDRRNYHLFQPLLYQVAMAGLSPCDIATPIRGLMSHLSNVYVVQGEVERIDPLARQVHSDAGVYGYDYLVLASGAQHAYFGQEHWEEHAPGLKTLEQATEVRRRVLSAFERAECERDSERRRALLTFVVVGGGPTGVELAGAIGEMSRFTLARDFRNIDPKLTRIVLLEAGARILPSFEADLSSRATRELERLGVQVWTHSRVTGISPRGVRVGEDQLSAATVLWAAGVSASPLGRDLGAGRDPQGRVIVTSDLSVPGLPEVFVVGDQAHFRPDGASRPLPGVATVAQQQGQHVAEVIRADLTGAARAPFVFRDKGQMAAIGRRRAVMQRGRWQSAGVFAWLAWLLVHIYFLSGFRNRLLVVLKWGWSYLTFARGSRLIQSQSWRSYSEPPRADSEPPLVSGTWTAPALPGASQHRHVDEEARA